MMWDIQVTHPCASESRYQRPALAGQCMRDISIDEWRPAPPSTEETALANRIESLKSQLKDVKRRRDFAARMSADPQRFVQELYASDQHDSQVLPPATAYGRPSKADIDARGEAAQCAHAFRGRDRFLSIDASMHCHDRTCSDCAWVMMCSGSWVCEAARLMLGENQPPRTDTSQGELTEDAPRRPIVVVEPPATVTTLVLKKGAPRKSLKKGEKPPPVLSARPKHRAGSTGTAIAKPEGGRRNSERSPSGTIAASTDVPAIDADEDDGTSAKAIQDILTRRRQHSTAAQKEQEKEKEGEVEEEDDSIPQGIVVNPK
jgi:hypothetical protein